MTIEDILNLTRAGFTKAEIMELVKPAPESPQNPQEQPQPEPQPETPAPAPEPVQPAPESPAPAPAAPAPAAPAPAAPAGPTTQDLMAAIQGLTAAVQGFNRNQAQMPDQHQMTGEDVLAQIIRPPRN